MRKLIKMVNYKIKKYAALILSPFLPLIIFAVCIIYYGIWWGLLGSFIGIIMSTLMSNLLLKNPFTNMLEGKGILAINMDSTGILQFFNLYVKQPELNGNFLKKPITDVFDRNTVWNLQPPLKNQGHYIQNDDGSLDIHVDKDGYNAARFGALQYPTVIWNDNVKSLVTKGWLSEQEKDSFIEHGLIYLNREIEKLTSIMRDFARHVVETTKPDKKFWESKGSMVIVIIVFVVLAILFVMFLPSIITTIKGGASGSVGGAINAASNSIGAINPK